MSLFDDGQADVVDAFGTASRCLEDILNINNVYFDNMVGQICPSGLRLGRANASGTEAAFLDLHLSVSGGIVSAKVCDGRDDFDFGIVNFPFEMVVFLILHPVGSVSLCSFVLLGRLAVLLASALAVDS